MYNNWWVVIVMGLSLVPLARTRDELPSGSAFGAALAVAICGEIVGELLWLHHPVRAAIALAVWTGWVGYITGKHHQRVGEREDAARRSQEAELDELLGRGQISPEPYAQVRAALQRRRNLYRPVLTLIDGPEGERSRSGPTS